MGEDTFTYRVVRRDQLLIVDTQTPVPEDHGVAFYDAVRAAAVAPPAGVRAIIFDSSTVESYHAAVVRQGFDFVKVIDALDIRIFVVSPRAIFRMAIAAAQVFARHPIRSFATLEQALQAAEKL